MSQQSLRARVQALAGGNRCARILDGSDASFDAFAQWFLPAWWGGIGEAFDGEGGLLVEAYEGWTRALDDPATLAWFTSTTGADPRILARGLIGVGRVEFREVAPFGMLWEPAVKPDGVRAVLIPVTMAGFLGADVERVASGIDIVAVDPGNPTLPARRTGMAWALGPGRGLEPSVDWDGWPRRVRLHRSPIDWLAGGIVAGSYCILDWHESDARDLLRLIDTTAVAAVVDDDAYAAELRARIRPKRPKLMMEVAA